ncbi:hypothetical protein SLOPH_2375 [Spraguea lophii 42_110]|uniref:Uncharacterized protein n=1 Tax=Spraguea lophii (strain 42_110) TaxID=1358809 RepID=S7WAF2_SPRLO|nr:hypothetical protein SLOPH_2375 [Spraguea lophii 42_110]
MNIFIFPLIFCSERRIINDLDGSLDTSNNNTNNSVFDLSAINVLLDSMLLENFENSEIENIRERRVNYLREGEDDFVHGRLTPIYKQNHTKESLEQTLGIVPEEYFERREWGQSPGSSERELYNRGQTEEITMTSGNDSTSIIESGRETSNSNYFNLEPAYIPPVNSNHIPFSSSTLSAECSSSIYNPENYSLQQNANSAIAESSYTHVSSEKRKILSCKPKKKKPSNGTVISAQDYLLDNNLDMEYIIIGDEIILNIKGIFFDENDRFIFSDDNITDISTNDKLHTTYQEIESLKLHILSLAQDLNNDTDISMGAYLNNLLMIIKHKITYVELIINFIKVYIRLTQSLCGDSIQILLKSYISIPQRSRENDYKIFDLFSTLIYHDELKNYYYVVKNLILSEFRYITPKGSSSLKEKRINENMKIECLSTIKNNYNKYQKYKDISKHLTRDRNKIIEICEKYKRKYIH